MTINFHKSELFLFGDAKNKTALYQEIFTCQLGELPLKYLGMPVSNVRIIRNKHWKWVVDKIEKRCGCWQEKLIGAIAGKITLVQACLTNIPLFMMSFYLIPVGVKKKG